MEEWSDIPEYEGLYMASSEGRVKSVSRTVKRRNGVNGSRYRTVKERILSQADHTHGYKTVVLGKNGNGRTRYVHRLVAGAFIPNDKNYRTVNHKNGNKKDNRVENLEWCSHSQNHKHAFTNGIRSVSQETKRKISISIRGVNAPLAKLTDKKVLEIRRKYSSNKFTQTELAKIYQITQQSISSIINGNTWRHLLPDDHTGELAHT